jgi:hypothetical protein
MKIGAIKGQATKEDQSKVHERKEGTNNSLITLWNEYV